MIIRNNHSCNIHGSLGRIDSGCTGEVTERDFEILSNLYDIVEVEPSAVTENSAPDLEELDDSDYGDEDEESDSLLAN